MRSPNPLPSGLSSKCRHNNRPIPSSRSRYWRRNNRSCCPNHCPHTICLPADQDIAVTTKSLQPSVTVTLLSAFQLDQVFAGALSAHPNRPSSRHCLSCVPYAHRLADLAITVASSQQSSPLHCPHPRPSLLPSNCPTSSS